MQAKIAAAYSLLVDKTTTFEKFDKVTTLLKGINPKVDRYLNDCLKSIRQLKQISEGDVIELTAQAIPENTTDQKKRKKLLLVFIGHFKKLKLEVARIHDLYNQGKGDDGKLSMQEHVSIIGKIATTAKGPFGLISLAALTILGILYFINSSSVVINIQNNGCPTIRPPVNLPKLIPGISIPESIPSQGQAQARVPPVKFQVNAGPNNIKLSAFGLNYNFALNQRTTNLVFDNKPLIGDNLTVNLASAKEHTLIITCL